MSLDLFPLQFLLHFFGLIICAIFDNAVNHCIVLILLQLKLVSVPEMDYRVTDKGGPRGEVWMRGPSIFKFGDSR